MTSLVLQVKAMSKKLHTLTSPRMAAVMNNEGCGGWPTLLDCHISVGSVAPMEQVDFVGNTMRG